MKQSVIRYAVFDPITDLFWQRTNFYAMDVGPVYYVQFSKSLSDASLMSESEAKEVFQNLKTIKLIQNNGLDLKANIGNLLVAEIKISYELL